MGHHSAQPIMFDQPTNPWIGTAATNVEPTFDDRQPKSPLHPCLIDEPTGILPNVVAMRPGNAEDDAAIVIGQAYGRLHRVHAILVYVKTANIRNPGIGPILDEAKHTYEQALALYETRDFEVAVEYAVASKSLSQAIEIVISRALRSDDLYPSLVMLPPEYETTIDDSIRIQEDIHRVELLLSLIRRVAENGNTLSRDQTQTLNIASCSERLLRKVRHLLGFEQIKEAIDLVHAATITVRVAEYICRKWYATQDMDSFLSTNSPVICDEPSIENCKSDERFRTLAIMGANKSLVDWEEKAQV